MSKVDLATGVGLPVMLTTAEVAERLHVAASTLSRWRMAGIGPMVYWLGPSVNGQRDFLVGGQFISLSADRWCPCRRTSDLPVRGSFQGHHSSSGGGFGEPQ